MEKVTHTSGSAFRAIDPDRAAGLELRAALMNRVEELLEGLNQNEAAARLGVDQPRISDIRRGKFSRFSAEKLADYLEKLGERVEMRFVKARAKRPKEWTKRDVVNVMKDVLRDAGRKAVPAKPRKRAAG
jgi:predicted XRE-type DNA-binding protein